MLIPLLLLAGGIGVAAASKKKEEEQKLIRVAQDYRAEAARLREELKAMQGRYSSCSEKLATFEPPMPPQFMAAGECARETGEDERNL